MNDDATTIQRLLEQVGSLTQERDELKKEVDELKRKNKEIEDAAERFQRMVGHNPDGFGSRPRR